MVERKSNLGFLATFGMVLLLLIISLVNFTSENISLAQTNIEVTVTPTSDGYGFVQFEGQESNNLTTQANYSSSHILNIENYDANNNVMTIHVQHNFTGNFTGAIWTWNFGVLSGLSGELLGDPSFSPTGSATCYWIPATSIIQCTGNLSSISISYQVKPNVQNSSIIISPGFNWGSILADITYDFYYPSSLSVDASTSKPDITEDGHLGWTIPSTNGWSTQITLNVQTYSVTGKVIDENSNPVSGVTISTQHEIATTDSRGVYTLTNLLNGTHTLTPTIPEHTFEPTSRVVRLPPNRAGQDFRLWPCESTEPDGFLTIPVHVFVLENVEIDYDDIRLVINRANSILKQANIRLDHSSTTWNFNDQGNHTGDILNYNQYFDVGTESFSRVLLTNQSKRILGFSLVFANKIVEDKNAGLAQHNQYVPVVFVKNLENGFWRIRQMGHVLAHEFSHAFTLGSNHKIEDKNADCDWDDPEEKASINAHTDIQNYDNLMHPSASWDIVLLGFEDLTQDQIHEIFYTAKDVRAGKFTPHNVNNNFISFGSITTGDKFGGWIDDRGDVSESYLDLTIGTFLVKGLEEKLDLTIGLNGLHPDETAVNSLFEILFDTDNDSNTGISVGPFDGIDKILTLNITGKYPFTTEGIITAEISEVMSGNLTTLSPGFIDRIELIADSDQPENIVVTDFADLIYQSVPLSSLNFTSDEVPIGMRATNLDTGEVDEVIFQFNINPPPEPQIDVSPNTGYNGVNVRVDGGNFTPNNSIKLLIDDTNIHTTTTSFDGSFTTSFYLPVLQSGFYFITAQDEEGKFDFTVFTYEGSNTYLPIIQK